MNIPATLTAGDSWAWTESEASYPAPTWVLSFHFSGPKSFSVAGTASGTDHAFAVTAANTKDQPHGTYRWIARAVNGSTTTTLASGSTKIEANLANLAADNRTLYQRMLADFETAIANKAVRPDVLSYSIAGRSQSFANWDELFAAYDRIKMLVAKEMGLKPGRVFIRTGNA